MAITTLTEIWNFTDALLHFRNLEETNSSQNYDVAPKWTLANLNVWIPWAPTDHAYWEGSHPGGGPAHILIGFDWYPLNSAAPSDLEAEAAEPADDDFAVIAVGHTRVRIPGQRPRRMSVTGTEPPQSFSLWQAQQDDGDYVRYNTGNNTPPSPGQVVEDPGWVINGQHTPGISAVGGNVRLEIAGDPISATLTLF